MQRLAFPHCFDLKIYACRSSNLSPSPPTRAVATVSSSILYVADVSVVMVVAVAVAVRGGGRGNAGAALRGDIYIQR